MIALTSVKSGNVGKVAALKTQDETTLRKLIAMGVHPGISITLEQRFPSYIIKVGRTRAAVDRETARIIFLNGTAI